MKNLITHRTRNIVIQNGILATFEAVRPVYLHKVHLFVSKTNAVWAATDRIRCDIRIKQFGEGGNDLIDTNSISNRFSELLSFYPQGLNSNIYNQTIDLNIVCSDIEFETEVLAGTGPFRTNFILSYNFVEEMPRYYVPGANAWD
jgi:hypothetical protein